MPARASDSRDCDSDVPWPLRRHPTADITPEGFEEFAAEGFEEMHSYAEDLRVCRRERVDGTDGAFEFEVTVRYRSEGFDFLVVVEVKRHRHSIRRSVVQTLHSKMHSVGAQKGVVVATALFQRGALEFATTHGIALIFVTESRFSTETYSEEPRGTLTRELFGLPTFAAYWCRAAEPSDWASMHVSLVSGRPARVRELLLDSVGDR